LIVNLINIHFVCCKNLGFRHLIIKVWSTFLKVVGVGNAHKYFHFHNLTTAEQPAVWRIEHNGESPKMRQLNQSQAVVFY